jgi:hypothetical protein
MIVPVVVSPDDAEANDGIVHVAEGLVVPGVRGSVGGQLLFDDFEGLVPGFKDGEVREFGGHLRLLSLLINNQPCLGSLAAGQDSFHGLG